ncbi:hypothetical protein [Streptomyces sp. 150FB]|uniref:hypothetical protein n=1 Tax=Streptomyces sp. 150FB TaxID=1576605 RepID=UPI001364BE21|nr:hypothetical protein [Streptomyces sp. 150FB]
MSVMDRFRLDGRVVVRTDIADPVVNVSSILVLVSDAASYISGTTLTVGGGAPIAQ